MNKLKISNRLSERVSTHHRAGFSAPRLQSYHEPTVKEVPSKNNYGSHVKDFSSDEEQLSCDIEEKNKDKQRVRAFENSDMSKTHSLKCVFKKKTSQQGNTVVYTRRAFRKRKQTAIIFEVPPDKKQIPRIPMVLIIYADFKLEMMACSRWERIKEETPEELEEYEKSGYCLVREILYSPSNRAANKEENDDIVVDCNAFFNKFGGSVNKAEEMTRYDFPPMQSVQFLPELPKPMHLHKNCQFTETDKEEFRQLFAEEAKILMPHLKNKKKPIYENIELCERPKKVYKVEKEALILDEDDDMQAETSFTTEQAWEGPGSSVQTQIQLDLLPPKVAANNQSGEDATSVKVPNDTTGTWLQNVLQKATYRNVLYVSIIVILSVCTVGIIVHELK